MKMYFSLSWRNIWRNKNRTLIAAASVFFAVLMAIVMRSAQLGSYAYMIDSSAKMFTGYLQIQQKNYWDKRSLDNSMVVPEQRLANIRAVDNVTAATRRLETFSLVSFGDKTKVAQILGIDPRAENRITDLKDQLVSGRYLTEKDQGVILGQGLARRLKITVGQKVVLFGQGYHGQIAAAEFPVVGIAKLRFVQLDNINMYMTLDQAQYVFSMPDRVTSVPVMIDNIRHLDQVKTDLMSLVDKDQIIKTWDEMSPEMAQSIMLDNSSGMIMLIILYIVIIFGVFGTVMMMVSERAKEYAILISVGMKKYRLILVTTLESIFVAFIGMITGAMVSLPIVLYLHFHPIPVTGDAAKSFTEMGFEAVFNFSTDPGIFFNQALVVFIIALATSLYPLFFISKLEPATAIRA